MAKKPNFLLKFAHNHDSSTLMTTEIRLYQRPQWIFFDLDDTLWDFASHSLESLAFIYENFPEPAQRFSTFEEFRDTYHSHNSLLWQLHAAGKISSEFLRSERWRATLFPEAEPTSPPKACATIDSAYLEFLAKHPGTLKGAGKLLRSLSHDYMLGVLSNGFSATQYAKVYNSGLWKRLTRIITSEEIGIQKPNPEIYRYAVAATGAAGTPTMVGDNPDTDIIGALRAGWKAIWLNPLKKVFPYSDSVLLSEGINPELFLGSAECLDEVEKIIRSQ